MADDPAEDRIQQTIRTQFARVAAAERTGSTEDLQVHLAAANYEIQTGMKEYMSSTDRFAARMQASLGKDAQQQDDFGTYQDEEDPSQIKARINLTETERASAKD